MLSHYLLLAFRTLLKNKPAFFINLVGMTIALGCCIAAFVNYQFNNGFDKQQKKAADIYRVSFYHDADGRRTPFGVVPLPMAELVAENFKEIDEAVRYISKDAEFRIGDEMFRKQFVYTDPIFLNLFTLDQVAGSLDLTDKSKVLISDKLAKTYYGNTDPVGQPLTQIISGQPREFTIGGVYKAFPFNSSFRFDLLTTFENYFVDATQRDQINGDWKKWTTLLVEIKNKSILPDIEQRLQQYIAPQNEAREDLKATSFYIEPFVGMGTRAIRERNQGHWFNAPMPPAAVIAPFAMAGFLLLVACFNFTNNAIAMAGRRLKEIGIRKAVGGRRKELIIQFFAETFLFCFIALGLAMLTADFFVGGWDALWPSIELTVTYKDNLPFILSLVGLMTVTALLAGSYPALYISSFKPIQVLRGTVKLGGTNLFTKSLLVFQFSISLAAIIFALAFYFNSKYQKEFDLGYSYRSVVQVPIEGEQQFNQLKNELIKNPTLLSVSGTEHHIYASNYKASVKVDKMDEKEVDILNVGDDYFETVNVRLIAGRGFEKDRASDVDEAIIVNEEFARVFNLGDRVLGSRVLLGDTAQCFVIGVVKDVYLKALFQPLAPLVFKYVEPTSYRFLVASTDPSNLDAANEQIRSEWKKLFPNQLYTGRLMEENMVMAMEHFDNVVVLYTFLGIVAIIMSVSGLYSLMSLNLQRRTKELGVRKILGAPLFNMVLQASKLFLIVMGISFAVGGLLGSVMVNALMDNVWEYYEAINIKVLSLAVVILFLIATATIGLRVANVITTNPADSLRHE